MEKSVDNATDRNEGKKHGVNVTMSAPPKMGGKATEGEKPTLQKNIVEDDTNEKVHIPETFEDSDSDSDLGDRIRRLEGFGDIGQGSSKNNDEEVHQIWHMDSNLPAIDPKQLITKDLQLKMTEVCNQHDEQPTSVGNEKPSEMDFSEEAIVNTQESIETGEELAGHELAGQDDLSQAKEVADGNHIKMNNMKPQETRSERLMEDITKTTQEKYEKLARKRNLEGTTTASSSNMFSDLPVEAIKEISSDFGIDVNQISFGTFDLIKDLEIARNNLHAKKHEVVISESDDDETVEEDMNERLIEWLKDEPSETESEILALSKKKGKLSKRKLKISSNSKTKSQAQEAPGLKRGGKGGKVGPLTPKSKKKKVKK